MRRNRQAFFQRQFQAEIARDRPNQANRYVAEKDRKCRGDSESGIIAFLKRKVKLVQKIEAEDQINQVNEEAVKQTVNDATAVLRSL